MKDIKSLHTDVLVEMLAKDTADYLRMRAEGAASVKEFNACKKNMNYLQVEILSRKKPVKKKQPNTTKQPAKFPATK